MDGWDKLVVVCGPTATGKTALALHIARQFGGEVISADSMQVYRGLVVGTAAVTPGEAAGVPVHLSGFLPPEVSFSVAEWLEHAKQAIGDIHGRGRLPVVCGGTGLYIKSLVEGTAFVPAGADVRLRAQLEARWDEQGGAALLAQLAVCDPDAAARLHLNDKKRIIRALELYEQTGQTAAQRAAASHAKPAPYRALCIGVNYGQRAELYAAIEARVDGMMESGLLEEAHMVWQNRAAYATAAQAIGYKEFFSYFDTGEDLDSCVQRLKQATRNYAKRQLTWFGHMQNVHWLLAGQAAQYNIATQMVADFLL